MGFVEPDERERSARGACWCLSDVGSSVVILHTAVL